MGNVFGSWPISEDRTVEIGDGNRLVIEDGKADMVWADCPDKLCVNQKAISREGESIICLPNKWWFPSWAVRNGKWTR